ncbi:MAG: hypothetical protein ACRC7N_16065 [Clostridium sp.]
MAININGVILKDKDYLQQKREQITTTVEENRLREFRQLMKALNKPTTMGWDMLIDLLDDENILQEFVHKVRNY